MNTLRDEIIQALNEIDNKIEKLRNTELSQQQNELIDSVQSNADSILVLIDDTQQPGEKSDTSQKKDDQASEGKAGNQIHILVVEDRPVNQKIVLNILQKSGYEAEAVTNGSEAVEALETKKYDLVLMDLDMPEMNGIEATRIIRDPKSNVLNHEVAIIALTGFDFEENRDTCLKEGMNDFLPKPVNPEELLTIVEKHLS